MPSLPIKCPDMAPEIGLGKKYDGKAVDVFSASVLLYRLLYYQQYPWMKGDALPEHLRPRLIKQMQAERIQYQ